MDSPSNVAVNSELDDTVNGIMNNELDGTVKDWYPIEWYIGL